MQLSRKELSWPTRVRNTLGDLSKGIKPGSIDNYDPEGDIEYSHVQDADEIAAPSKAIREKLIQIWSLDPAKVALVPLPYQPLPALLQIPLETYTDTVTFIGRLEARKGVLHLAQAIPLVLQRYPKARFRFVGSSRPSPNPFLDMGQYLKHKLRKYGNAVEFLGPVSSDKIPKILATTDICVFPSLWENFGLVCLEAMAAGRGVIGSNAGGISEIINSDRVGRLVPPASSHKIAASVLELLENPRLRISLGAAARDRILTEYSFDRIGAIQEASYTHAIIRRRTLGTRWSPR